MGSVLIIFVLAGLVTYFLLRTDDVEDLKTLFGTVFSGDAQQYNLLSKAGKVTYASLRGYELMGKPC